MKRKTFTKEHSREYSLFRVRSWYYSMNEKGGELWGMGVEENCVVYRGGDLVDVYYEPNELKKVFAQMMKKCGEDSEYVKNEINNFLRLFQKLKPYYLGSKKIESIEELRKVYELYSDVWAYTAMIFVLPTLPVTEELKKLALKAREETQEYNETSEELFKEKLEEFFPHLKGKTRFILPEEVWNKEVEKSEIFERIKEREKGFIYYGGRIYTGELQENLDKLGIRLENKKSAVSGEAEYGANEIKGQIAYKGKVSGRVKIVSSVEDLPKVQEGDVLVAAMTMPKYLPAMKRAAALVTDEGGITCHAAIVSRELGKPCVIGTKIATEVLKDGMKVEVDADNGIVKILEKKKKYEMIFRIEQMDVLTGDNFFKAYAELDPVTIIKDENMEMYVSGEKLKELSEKGYELALEPNSYKEYEKKALKLGKEMLQYQDTELSQLSNKEFTDIVEKFFDIGGRFLKEYKKTEFIFFTKVEKILEDYIEGKCSFEELMKDKVDLSSWPKDKKNLAEYIIKMQHLKFKLRGFINAVYVGDNCVLIRMLEELMKRTQREDSICMTLDEIKDYFDGKEVGDVSGRHLGSYILIDKETGNLDITVGDEAERKINELKREIPKDKVTGTVAHKGKVTGKVKIIISPMASLKELDKVEKGDILVSNSTGPEMMLAVKKAAAIVTEEGGMMSHAAVVSREFDIPCIVGTKVVTEVFKDGDLVEVDADNGIVRILKD